MPDNLILMGVVGRPHGVRGLVHLHSYAAEPDSLADYPSLRDDRGRSWTLVWRGAGIAELRDGEGRALDSREAAAAMTNRRLYVPREALPPAGEDEFYLADLVGLEARDGGDAVIGRVAEVHDYGAGPSLEIAREGAGPLLLPFTRACVPVVDVAGGFVRIELPDEVEVHDEDTELSA